jgi:hypothetical protein
LTQAGKGAFFKSIMISLMFHGIFYLRYLESAMLNRQFLRTFFNHLASIGVISNIGGESPDTIKGRIGESYLNKKYTIEKTNISLSFSDYILVSYIIYGNSYSIELSETTNNMLCLKNYLEYRDQNDAEGTYDNCDTINIYFGKNKQIPDNNSTEGSEIAKIEKFDNNKKEKTLSESENLGSYIPMIISMIETIQINYIKFTTNSKGKYHSIEDSQYNGATINLSLKANKRESKKGTLAILFPHVVGYSDLPSGSAGKNAIDKNYIGSVLRTAMDRTYNVKYNAKDVDEV